MTALVFLKFCVTCYGVCDRDGSGILFRLLRGTSSRLKRYSGQPGRSPGILSNPMYLLLVLPCKYFGFGLF